MSGRVTTHPILGNLPPAKPVTFTFDGRAVEGMEGEPIAAALLANGIRILRHSEAGCQPRSIYCGIGHCYECRVSVNGQAGFRACITPVQAGMVVEPAVEPPPAAIGGNGA
ncbi:MAG TPA: (2Fe-2S)-binding protein [Symbiobacteriaceae bacterium]|nr:(2Fe-2S)-binding protein [Symbiobacteriaceae bacterium]